MVNRDDILIFEDIGWYFPINMLLNAIWLPTFQSNTAAGFVASEVIISVMLFTALSSAKAAVARAQEWEWNWKDNWMALIGVRGGLSIYSGWLTAARLAG